MGCSPAQWQRLKDIQTVFRDRVRVRAHACAHARAPARTKNVLPVSVILIVGQFFAGMKEL